MHIEPINKIIIFHNILTILLSLLVLRHFSAKCLAPYSESVGDQLTKASSPSKNNSCNVTS